MFGSLESCHDRAAASVIHCMPKNSVRPACVSFLTACWHISTWHSLRASNSLRAEALVAGQRVCLFWPHDGTSALGIHCGPVIHCMPKHSLQASVCVFSDRMMAHQHLEFVAGQRVCLFWPHDGVSAAVIHCYQQPSFIASTADQKFFQDNAWDCDIMLVDPCILYGYVLMFGSLDSCHDRAAASVIHCMPKNSLQASVCVFSDRMMAHQHLEFVAGQ